MYCKKQVYIPDPNKPGESKALYYHDVDQAAERLASIVNQIGPSLHPADRERVLEGIQHNHEAYRWQHCSNIVIQLTRAGEECTVYLDLDLSAQGGTKMPTTDDGELTMYRLYTAVSWPSSHFGLARAIIHAQLHQEAAVLMAEIENAFDGPIGVLAEDV